MQMRSRSFFGFPPYQPIMVLGDICLWPVVVALEHQTFGWNYIHTDVYIQTYIQGPPLYPPYQLSSMGYLFVASSCITGASNVRMKLRTYGRTYTYIQRSPLYPPYHLSSMGDNNQSHLHECCFHLSLRP